MRSKPKKSSARAKKVAGAKKSVVPNFRKLQDRLAAAIVESSEDAIVGKSLDGIITSWNQGAERLFGYTAKEIIGQPVGLLIPPDRIDEEPGILARLQRGERVEHFETLRRRKSGELVPVSLTISPIRDEKGKIIGASKIARDISERKEIEKAQHDRREQLSLFIEHCPAALAMFDLNMRYLAVSRRWLLDYQIVDQEILGRSHYKIFPDISERWKAIHRRCLSDAVERCEEDPFVRGNGGIQWLRWEVRPWYTLDKKVGGIVIFSEDITERKTVEATLRESEERFRQIAENITEVFWITNVGMDQIIYVSPAYEKIWGRTCASLYERPLNWIDAIHPDDRARVIKAALSQVQKVNYDETYRILRPDGSVRWVHDRGFPIRNADGEVYRIVGTAEDITKQRKLEEQFLQAQKMEAIGTLAGGIAHDFNNILAAITGYAELGKMATKDLPKVRDYLDTILQAGNRAIGLVKQILTFSRQHEQERQPTQLREVVEESMNLLRATIPAPIEFNLSLAKDANLVLADANQIHQVIMNLGTNAWHAMKDKSGRLCVKLENFTVDAALSETHAQLRPGPYVRISVSDTGCGMERATIEHIFEPFYTTKARGEGTGLGLSVVHGIMESHDGAITVYSQVGEGTVFHLYFPAETSEASAAPVADGPPSLGDGQRILFVDDEEVLAKLGKKSLTQLGYQVEGRTGPVEALAVFTANPHNYDLVITDQNMPGMTGVDFAKQLLKIRPDIPIILTTGYSPTLTVRTIQAMGIKDLLPKPHTIRLLAQTVHRVLAKK